MKVLRGLFCLWAVIAAGPLHAQFEYGEILGTVRDATGAVVSGAKVTLTGLGLLASLQINAVQLERDVGFTQRDVGRERAGARDVVELHGQLLGEEMQTV